MKLLEGLNDAQREAVLHRDGPLLILAGAGSGKTRVVTRRIAHLIETGVSPGAILAITFTNKAAGEMRERVEALLPDLHRAAEQPIVATFHAFAVRVLRKYGSRLGLSERFAILDTADQLALIREAAVAARVDVKRHDPAGLAHVIGRAKERLDDAAFAREATSDVDRAAAAVLPGYRALQRERGALDFEDLVAETVRLLEEHPDVHRALLDRLRYVSIDEYQDTNHSQYRLAQLLAGERANLAVCGDPDQSIYGWRGADMRNILRFEEDFPGARVVLLAHNYRSTATILRASNALIEHNLERKDKQLLATGEEGEQIEVLACMDEGQEAELVARRIKREVEQGTPPGDIALIYRAGSMARRYEEALVRHEVPCALAGATSFFDLREIKDTLAFLRVAANPGDDLAALRALRVQGSGLGKRTVEKLSQFQREAGVPLVEACRRADQVPGLTEPRRAGLRRFAGVVDELRRGRSGSVEKLVIDALTRSGLEEALRSSDPDQVRRRKNLERLVDVARRADRKKAGGGDRLRPFLDGLALLDGQDKGDEAPDKVTLTTVHASKGLEFDVVVVGGLEQGLFPHRRAVEEGGLEEERRLAYVAFTRARKRLILSYAARRAARVRSNTRRIPSTFLYELPGELLWDPMLREPMELPDRRALERELAGAQALPGAGRKPGEPAAPGAPVRAPKGAKLLGAPTLAGAGRQPLWARGLSR